MSHTDDNRQRIFADIDAERARQDAKWGAQNHPMVGNPHESLEAQYGPGSRYEAKSAGVIECMRLGIPSEREARERCDAEHRSGRGTFASILVEELAEWVSPRLMSWGSIEARVGSCRVRAGAPGGPVVVSGKALISRSNFDDHPDPFPPRRPAGRRAQLRLAGHLSSSGGVAMSKGASASFGAMSAYSNACPDCRVSMSGVRACLQCLHRHGVEWDSISMLEDRDDASRISQRNSNSTDGRGDEPRSRQSPPLATPPSSALPRALSPPRLFATRKRKSTRCSRTPGRRGFRTSIPRILHAVAATNVQATERSRTIVHRSSERSDVSPGRCEWT